MTTKSILAFTVAAFALAGSLSAPGKAFAGVTDLTADLTAAPICAADVKPVADVKLAAEDKPAATRADDDRDDKQHSRGYDWRSVYQHYRDRDEPDYRRYIDRGQRYRDHDEPDYRRYIDRGQHYRDREEPDYRRYLDRSWGRRDSRRNRNDDN